MLGGRLLACDQYLGEWLCTREAGKSQRHCLLLLTRVPEQIEDLCTATLRGVKHRATLQSGRKDLRAGRNSEASSLQILEGMGRVLPRS